VAYCENNIDPLPGNIKIIYLNGIKIFSGEIDSYVSTQGNSRIDVDDTTQPSFSVISKAGEFTTDIDSLTHSNKDIVSESTVFATYEVSEVFLTEKNDVHTTQSNSRIDVVSTTHPSFSVRSKAGKFTTDIDSFTLNPEDIVTEPTVFGTYKVSGVFLAENHIIYITLFVLITCCGAASCLLLLFQRYKMRNNEANGTMGIEMREISNERVTYL
jgi:hypothetical protein